MRRFILLKKIISAVSAVCVMAVSGIIPQPASAAGSQMRNLTTAEIVRDMGIGINLGNTLESCGDWIAQWGDGSVKSYETAWGSPEITEDMIKGYAESGFETLRVPVAWSNLMSEDYTISGAYLERVKQIVNWALDAGMYVIMNLHYDGGWLENMPSDKENCMNKYKKIWTQLSEEFKDYGDYLIFESQNEELGWDSLWNRWSGSTEGKAESYDLVNEVNQTFVDIVRSSGGNNDLRHLLISGYKTDVELTCDPLFEMPQDPADRCAVSVHYYTPSDFAILEEDADWGKNRTTWGTEEDFAELNKNMDLMKSAFVDKGIPVIFGEYGCPKNNKEEDSVRLFLSSVCKAAYDRQMCPVLWDITGLHYDRNQCRMTDSTLNQQLLSVLDNNVLKGDINQDGKVDTQDVAILGDCLVKKAFLSVEDMEYADINSDGKINAFDYAAIKRIVINSASDKEQLDLSDMPTEYQAALDWVWTNRIEREKSTDRWNTIFDQIDAGNGTLNYVVRWQSYKTVTLDQRKQFEKLIEDSVNNWTDYLVGYDGWKYDHVDVNVIGWAVIDESVILDKQPDEIIYTDCTPYDSSGDTSNGYEEIPTLLPNAPDELSRMEHFYDRSYQYPGGLDKRFDMYLWATQGFPDIGGCGGDWGQRLSDNAYLNMLNGVNVHVFEHELGHGFGITDFYGEEGAIDGFPPGGFPEPTIMMAGNSAEITNYDGWQLRYIWSKIKNQTDSNGTRRFTE